MKSCEIFSFKTHRSKLAPNYPLKRPSIISRKSGYGRSKRLASVLNQKRGLSILMRVKEMTVSQLWQKYRWGKSCLTVFYSEEVKVSSLGCSMGRFWTHTHKLVAELTLLLSNSISFACKLILNYKRILLSVLRCPEIGYDNCKMAFLTCSLYFEKSIKLKNQVHLLNFFLLFSWFWLRYVK